MSAAEQRFLSRLGTVSTVVEMRTMARAIKNDRRTLVELKAVDNAYPLYGSVGSDPPQPLEQGPRAGARTASSAPWPRRRCWRGSASRSATSCASERRRLRIPGILTREPDRTLRAFTLGPRLLLSRAALAATGLVEPGSLYTFAYRLRLPAGKQTPRGSRRSCRRPFPRPAGGFAPGRRRRRGCGACSTG